MLKFKTLLCLLVWHPNIDSTLSGCSSIQ